MEAAKRIGVVGMHRREGPPQREWRRGAFRWVDPESGECLRVELCGPPELLEGLQAQGFERLTEHPALESDSDGVAEGRASIELAP